MEVPEVARNYTAHLFSIQGKCYLGEGAETRGTHRLAPAATLCCPRGGGKSAFEIPAPFKFQLTVLRKPLVVVGWCLHHESLRFITIQHQPEAIQ